MKSRETAKRALWMARYERAIKERDDYDQNLGRICWDTATYFFNMGRDARASAQNASSPYKSESAR